MLYIIFAKADDVAESIKEARKQAWTAPKDATANDIALFYFGGSHPGIYAVGRTATEAQPGVPDDWTESSHGFFARHKDIKTLGQPVYLQEIRKAFPTWKRWNNLRGVRVHIVPLDYQQRLTDLIATNNFAVQTLLKLWLSRDNERADDTTLTVRFPFVSEEASSAFEGLRTEAVTYKHGRSRALRDNALAKSNGICEACSVDYSALLEGKGVRVLQVHHRKQFAATDRPRLTKLSELAVVCANCHMLIHMDSKGHFRLRS